MPWCTRTFLLLSDKASFHFAGSRKIINFSKFAHITHLQKCLVFLSASFRFGSLPTMFVNKHDSQLIYTRCSSFSNGWLSFTNVILTPIDNRTLSLILHAAKQTFYLPMPILKITKMAIVWTADQKQKPLLWSIQTGFFLNYFHNYFLNFCYCDFSIYVFVLKSQKMGTQPIVEPK